MSYYGGITAEQFLFNEIKIVAKLYLENKSIDEIIKYIQLDNYFQYPTERMIPRMTRACYKRLIALNNDNLVNELITAPTDVAKQINLYAMMCSYKLVREFMIEVIGEKYRLQDYSYEKKEVNVFFSHLQSADEDIAAWSDQTISKIKQVLTKCLVEVKMLDDIKSKQLNHFFISSELKQGIYENNDVVSLTAFNCFD